MRPFGGVNRETDLHQPGEPVVIAADVGADVLRDRPTWACPLFGVEPADGGGNPARRLTHSHVDRGASLLNGG